MKFIILAIMLSLFASCKQEQKEEAEVVEVVKEKSIREINDELISKGYKTFDYVDEATKDTMLMQQYFIAFLKRGPNRSQSISGSRQSTSIASGAFREDVQ